MAANGQSDAAAANGEAEVRRAKHEVELAKAPKRRPYHPERPRMGPGEGRTSSYSITRLPAVGSIPAGTLQEATESDGK